MVNGDVVNIPSYTVRPGDVVSVRERSRTLLVIEENLGRSTTLLEWLRFDSSQFQGEIISMPEREQIPENINEQLIVELYSK